MMISHSLFLFCFVTILLSTQSTLQQDNVGEDDLVFAGPTFNFKCPEPNGFFRDHEQCDLYYECVNNQYEVKLCPDGLMFDDSKRNAEKCKYPPDVICGNRTYLQQPMEDRDKEHCVRGNGLYPHEETCNKFWSCDHGRAFEMPCASPLVFDVTVGGCVRVTEADDEVREKCDDGGNDLDGEVSKPIDGFTCPGKGVIGVNGLMQEHPIFRHPAHCRYFFVCQFGKFAQKLGCPEDQVFDSETNTCKSPEEVSDCRCWHSCGEESKCKNDCFSDCSCPTDEELLTLGGGTSINEPVFTK